jgi:ketosteroid isomerase-like protein
VRTFVTIALVALVVATVDCNFGSSSSSTASSTPTASGAEGDALMQVSRDWAKAAEARDVERTLSYWSDDAMTLEPDRPAIAGKAALRNLVQSGFKDPKFTITWEPEQAEISQAGDMGYLIEHNRITFTDTTGKVRTVFGKGVTIWKKDSNGTWKCVLDIFNNSPHERVFPPGL